MSLDWDRKAGEIQGRLDAGDKDFVNWSVVVASMHVGEQAPYIAKERRATSRWGLDLPDSNMAHQLYHLSQWMIEADKLPTNVDSVMEIGGGYGSMYHLWRKMNFAGDYFMYDYDPMIELQSLYCNQNGLQPPQPVSGELEVDLLIACFSLSEMTLEERVEVLDGIKFNHFLIAYMPVWDGVDNEGYFQSWGGERIVHPYLNNVVYLAR